VAERRHGQAQGVLEGGPVGVVLLEVGRHDVGRASHHAVALDVGHLAVVGEPVDLVVIRPVADLGDEELDLVGLLPAAGEDGAEGLGVGVGQAPTGDVAAVVGVAAHVGQPHSGDAEVLELVVAADGGEGDAVVDLGDLVQRLGGVLRDEQHATGELDDHHRATAGDALAGVVGPVLHQLLGRDVEGHAHRLAPVMTQPPGVRRGAACVR
jgi:hypothetical protein